MIFGSKFLMSAIYFFLKYIGYATDRHASRQGQKYASC